ncbi:hypothetical protein M2323_001841 [Rhodoblastus acidophilus]|uniref:DUF6538 domain-containing protein n=1 Tax=Rhodoblastus acidophilus TaxID=1074 RepID=UPI0022251F31|nr:DUF6538 domain-containing protein [Rhodoblastus acidophilus]MCW2283727.1 hypothetical protein [Rhodoblastus acidophilus]MCW2332924.1 hypothetical protein [Rhodoblastus acidophilus]
MAFVVFQSGALKLTTKYVMPWKDGVLYYCRRVPEDMRKHHNGKAHIRKSLGTRDATVAAKKAARLASEHDALWRSLRSPEANRHDLTSPETRAAGAALLDAMGFKPGEAHIGCDHTRDDSRELFDERMGLRVGPEYLQIRHNPTKGADQKAFEMGEMLNPVQVEAERLFYGRTSRILLSDALNEYLRLKGIAASSKPAKDAARAIKLVTDELGDLPLEALTRPDAIKVRDAFLASSSKTATVLAPFV